MQKITKFLIIFLLLISNLAYYLPLSAAVTTTDFEFNPHYILSDNDLQDYRSMNRADIQAFLENYPGILAELRTPDKDGNVRLASDIIYQAAQDYRINPKYILVKLQKEMSLITDTTPTQRQLDFACGYDCPDSGGCSAKNRGFGKQVDAAAGIMRWYYDNINTSPFIKKPNNEYIIDKTPVHPLTMATAFLYTYTPHLQGNQNFWKLWQNWFEQVYPDGTLLKSFNSSTVYMIDNGKKRPFANYSSLISRHNPKLIISVVDSEIARYPLSRPITLPNYSILKNNTNYYLLDYDTIRPFNSYDVVRKMGYQPEEIIEVTDEDLMNFNVGKPISFDNLNPTGKLIKLKENNNIYYIKDNQYFPVYDEQIAKINFPNLKIEKASLSILSSLERSSPISFNNGTLVGVKGMNRIYIVENGLKRHIASEDIFSGLGYNWDNVIWVEEITLSSYPDGEPLFLRSEQEVVGSSTSTLVINIDNVDSPVITPGKMLTTPATSTKYIGDIFDTNVNVYLIADYKTGKVLAGKNVDIVRPMASFTKVMTGYRLFKEGLKLANTATFKESTQRAVYDKFRIKNGEKIKNSDLLNSLLISSVNTAARILVAQVDSNEDKFIKRMNDQAKTWGLKNTVFTDTYGYDLGNQTTAREYLTLFTKSLTNPALTKILGTKDYSYKEVLDKDKLPRHFDENSNHLVNKAKLGFNIIATKTGYLDEAGSGIVMLVERPKDKKKFVVITMGNPDYTHRFVEPEKITKWALTNF